MICPACKNEVPADAAFCPQCGQKVGGGAIVNATAPAAVAPDKATAGTGAAVSTEPERDLWSGTFSPKAMYGNWAAVAVITIVAIAIAVLIPIPATWIAVAIAVPVIWAVLAAQLLSLRWGVAYKLTTQRFLHQTGILRQVHNRILLIDIEDVSFEQKLMERFVNVGTIKLTATDVSDQTLVMRGIDNVQYVANLIDDARREERRRRALILQQHDTHHAT